MSQLTSTLATSGPGGLVGGGIGWVVFDAFSSVPSCSRFPCPSVEESLLGFDALSFVLTAAAVGALVGWFLLVVQGNRSPRSG